MRIYVQNIFCDLVYLVKVILNQNLKHQSLCKLLPVRDGC